RVTITSQKIQGQQNGDYAIRYLPTRAGIGEGGFGEGRSGGAAKLTPTHIERSPHGHHVVTTSSMGYPRAWMAAPLANPFATPTQKAGGVPRTAQDPPCSVPPRRTPLQALHFQ